MTASFTCLTCGTVHFSSDAYIACRDSHPPPSLIERLRHGSIDDDLLEAAKEAADEIEKLRAARQLAEPVQPYINCWAVRDVYFNDDGHPSMHREPPQQRTPLTDAQIDGIWLMRDCNEAIQAGDILAQVRCAVRVAERAHGIGEAQ